MPKRTIPVHEVTTKWYTFSQNNSGGRYVGPEYVIVEATDKAAACAIAERHGVYFHGVEEGQDCPCCGDRWYEPWGNGNDVPSIYDEPHGERNPIFGRASALLVHFGERTETAELGNKDD